MSTAKSAVSLQRETECERDLHAFLCDLEADSSLLEPERLRARLAALDHLDIGFGWADSEEFANGTNSGIHGRAKALQTRLEAANAELYRSIRAEIVRGGHMHRLLQFLQHSANQSEPEGLLPELGFDWRDELVSDLLQFREPSEADLQGSLEMVPYQPTPVRHILDLIETGVLSGDPVFVD